MSKSMKNSLNDIVGDLRGSANKVKIWETIFIIFLLTFTAYNTFRLFGESFEKLGLLLAVAAIGFFDGGFLFWGHQVRKVAKDFNQRAVASTMRWVCGAAAVSMTAIDMVLHSGQEYIPLDATVQLFGGWTATIQEVVGASAMFILVGVLIANLMSISLFEDLDIDIKQAIKERVAENDARNRELAAFEAKSRLQNELAARMIEQMAIVGKDEIEEEADRMAKELLPEIRGDFVDEIRVSRQKRQQSRVLEGRFENDRNKPKFNPNIPQPIRQFAKDTEDNDEGIRIRNNRPNPPKA